MPFQIFGGAFSPSEILARLSLNQRRHMMPKRDKSKTSKPWISRDAVFQALEMNDVLEHYGISSGQGQRSSFRVHCPFHEDDRPSCSVNTDAKVFNCFACGEQGNVLDFIAGLEDLDPSSDFRAVLEKAIEILGHNPTAKRASKQQNVKCKPKSSKYAGDNIQQNSEVGDADPLAGKTNSKTKKDRQGKPPKRAGHGADVGQAVNVDNSLELEPNRILEGPAFPLKLDHHNPWLKQRLKAIGMSSDDAVRLGIGYETRSNALMAGRICFPIHNSNGELVAYAGRWASDECDDKDGKKQERYRLPSGFKKQLELYNLAQVVSAFSDNKHLVIVEGFWSALRLSSLNIPVVALMGLTISQSQIALLKHHDISHLTLMLDGDDEGRKASQKLLKQLSPYFFLRNTDLNEDNKPDDVDVLFLERFRFFAEASSKAEWASAVQKPFNPVKKTEEALRSASENELALQAEVDHIQNQNGAGCLTLAEIGSTSFSMKLSNYRHEADW